MNLNQPIPAAIHAEMLKDLWAFMGRHQRLFYDEKKYNDDLESLDKDLDFLTAKYKDYYFTDSTNPVSNTFIFSLIEPNLVALEKAATEHHKKTA